MQKGREKRRTSSIKIHKKTPRPLSRSSGKGLFLKTVMLRKISNFFKTNNIKVWLVGGFLRDRLLGIKQTKIIDMDFAVEGNALKLAREFSNKIGGSFLALDKKRGCARVIYKNYILDFANLRAGSIQEDLKNRDFTINALAVELGSKTKEIIDPTGGLADLKLKRIKVVKQAALKSDPLRIIRAFGLSSRLGFKIEKKTISLIKQNKTKVKSVSGERLWEEFYGLLVEPHCFKNLQLMDKLGILDEILPEIKLSKKTYQGAYHHLNVWRHSLLAFEEFEKLTMQLHKTLPKLHSKLKNYLNSELSTGRKRTPLLKLAVFLHDLGKPLTKKKEDGKIKFIGHEKKVLKIIDRVSKRLKLSNAERDFLKVVSLNHLRPGYLSDLEKISKKAIFHFFRDTKNEGVGVLLLSIADRCATLGPLSTKKALRHHNNLCIRLIKEFYKSPKKTINPPRLVNGKDIMKHLNIKPGPLVGKILRQIQEAQAEEKIKTKTQALRYIKKWRVKNG